MPRLFDRHVCFHAGRPGRQRAVCVSLSLLCLMLSPTLATAIVHQGQGWFLNTARGPIAGKWKLYLEAQPRVNGDGLRQLLLRPAVGYQLTKHWSLWQGYGWTPSFNAYNSENRIFQQSLVETPRGELPVSLVNRTRLEERFIHNVSGVSVRLRHMFRAVYPLVEAGTWNLAAYDEPFVTLNTTAKGPPAGFDQNRAFLGLNRALTAHLRVEGGYLNQFVNAPSGKEDRMNHAALVWLDYVW